MDNEEYKKAVQENQLRGLTTMTTYQKMKKLVEETKFQLKTIKRDNAEMKQYKESRAYAEFTDQKITELYKLYEIE